MNKKYLEFKTDMADERVDTYKRVHNLSEIDGIKVESKNDSGVIITVVDVFNENGTKAVQKEIGKYITIELSDFNFLDDKERKHISDVLASQVKELIGKDSTKSVFVVGLGNEEVTPDSLGPKVIKKIQVTRHILNFAKELIKQGTREVSAIAPRCFRNYWN